MRYGLAFILLAGTFAASLAWPQNAPATVKKKTAAKKSAKSSAPVKSAKAKSAKTVRSAKSSKSGKTARSAHRTVTPARQAAPTPERYKEIQQALVDKGYLKSEPTGVWDADSIDAMTRFQNDQKLPPTGKLTAASLIKLGLGPSTAGPATGITGAESAAESGTAPPAALAIDAPHPAAVTDPPHSTPEN